MQGNLFLKVFDKALQIRAKKLGVGGGVMVGGGWWIS